MATARSARPAPPGKRDESRDKEVPLDTKQRELWSRLEAFEFDPPGVELTFTRRLARECGWSRTFAQEVVQEYRRFLLLAVSAGHPVTPSEEVDQAWHLHLAYSVSYWEELCGRVLGRALHHGPTRGGREEAAKFEDWYARTLASYARIFGAPAPAHLWPPAERRFAPAPRFRQVDTQAHWLLPKRWVGAGALWLAGLGGAGCVLASDDGSGTGAARWIVIVLVVLGVQLARKALRRSRRSHRRRRESTSGGPACATGCGSGALGSDTDSSAGDSGCGASGCGGGGCGGD